MPAGMPIELGVQRRHRSHRHNGRLQLSWTHKTQHARLNVCCCTLLPRHHPDVVVTLQQGKTLETVSPAFGHVAAQTMLPTTSLGLALFSKGTIAHTF